MRYRVVVYGGLITQQQEYESSSRNSRKHCRDTGADHCDIYNKRDEQVSSAVRNADGSIVNVDFD